MAITALPTPPSRQDPANFAARGDAFFGAFPQFVADANALQSDVNAKQQAAALSQIAAAASQAAAAASQSAASVSANLAAASTGAVLWVSGTNYAAGFVVYSALTGRSYRRLAAGAGTTDPSADAVNWRPLLLDIDTGYPTTLPSLILDFANSKALDPRITFSRASTGTYYDGRTVAMAEQNLLMYSQEFSNSSWIKNSGVTVSNNSGTSPDGLNNASLLTAGSNAAGYLYGAFQSTAGLTYTLSIYVKAGSKTTFDLSGTNQGAVRYTARFDLSEITATAIEGTPTCNIVSIGNGWFRCSITKTHTNGNVNDVISVYPGNIGSVISGDTIYIWGAQVEQRNQSTAYTLTTGAPITNYIPVLKTAASGVARFDHNPNTGESLGLLIEEQRTNLLTYSDQFDSTSWVKDGCTVSANCAIAPDGTLTADLISGVSGNRRPYQTVTTVSGTAYTMSVFAKAGTSATLTVTFVNVAGPGPVFTFSTGSWSTVSGWSTSVQAVGDGWYRISATYTASVTTSGPAWAVDGTTTVYLWGAQLEAGAFATSYIPTTSAQVTRSADVAYLPTAGWMRFDEGSLLASFRQNLPTSVMDTNAVYFGTYGTNGLVNGNDQGWLLYTSNSFLTRNPISTYPQVGAFSGNTTSALAVESLGK